MQCTMHVNLCMSCMTHECKCLQYLACNHFRLTTGARSIAPINKTTHRKSPEPSVACKICVTNCSETLDTGMSLWLGHPPGVGHMALADKQHTVSRHAGAGDEPKHRQGYHSPSLAPPGSPSATTPGTDASPSSAVPKRWHPRISLGSGQFWPKSGRVRPNSKECGAPWTEVVPSSANLGPDLATLGRHRAEGGPPRP